MNRCQKEYTTNYKNYGGRGIKVCDQWQDYEVFENWALSHGYDEKASRGECTLDRINVNGNYEPSNCRFIPIKEQQRNRTNTILITVRGETKSLSEWSDIFCIPRQTLRQRYLDGKKDKDLFMMTNVSRHQYWETLGSKKEDEMTDIEKEIAKETRKELTKAIKIAQLFANELKEKAEEYRKENK